MGHVVQFEFPSTDMTVSRKFFDQVLGRSFQTYDTAEEYWLAMTGDLTNPGIKGALYSPSELMNGMMNTVSVENLDATLARVLANGGQIVHPKVDIPGVGLLAYVRAPGGAIFGIIQLSPGGGM